jgi:hypothetical protein
MRSEAAENSCFLIDLGRRERRGSGEPRWRGNKVISDNPDKKRVVG